MVDATGTGPGSSGPLGVVGLRTSDIAVKLDAATLDAAACTGLRVQSLSGVVTEPMLIEGSSSPISYDER